jgi:hypothetical protein
VEGEGGDTRFFAQSVKLLSSGGSDENEATPPKGLRIRLRDSQVDTLDALETLLCKLRETPHLHAGIIELSAPLGDDREARWRLRGQWAIDPDVRKALKANGSIEMIEEIAA